MEPFHIKNLVISEAKTLANELENITDPDEVEDWCKNVLQHVVVYIENIIHRLLKRSLEPDHVLRQYRLIKRDCFKELSDYLLEIISKKNLDEYPGGLMFDGVIDKTFLMEDVKCYLLAQGSK